MNNSKLLVFTCKWEQALTSFQVLCQILWRWNMVSINDSTCCDVPQKSQRRKLLCASLQRRQNCKLVCRRRSLCNFSPTKIKTVRRLSYSLFCAAMTSFNSRMCCLMLAVGCCPPLSLLYDAAPTMKNFLLHLFQCKLALAMAMLLFAPFSVVWWLCFSLLFSAGFCWFLLPCFA